MDESAPEVEVEVEAESGSEVHTEIYNAVLQAMGIEDPAAWIDENVTYKRDGTPVISVPTPTPEPEGAGASASPAPSPSPNVRKRPAAAAAAAGAAPASGAVVGADIGLNRGDPKGMSSEGFALSQQLATMSKEERTALIGGVKITV